MFVLTLVLARGEVLMSDITTLSNSIDQLTKAISSNNQGQVQGDGEISTTDHDVTGCSGERLLSELAKAIKLEDQVAELKHEVLYTEKSLGLCINF